MQERRKAMEQQSSREGPSAGAAGLGGALVLAVLVGLAWLAYRAADPEPEPAAAAVSVPSSGIGSAWPSVPVLPDAVPVAAVAPPAAPASEAAACDGASNGGDVASVAASRLPESSRARLQAALGAASDPLARAAELTLRRRPTGDSGLPSPADSGRPVSGGPGLQAEAAGSHRPDAAVVASASGSTLVPAPTSPGTGSRDTLARMAVASGSPQVYALAWRACGAGDAAGSGVCQMLSAEQWARIDPDNAVPWLELAGRAQARGDTATVAEAMFHVSKARSVDFRWQGVVEVALRLLPSGLPVAERLQLATELLNAESSAALPAYPVVLAYCKPEQLLDSNRLQQCSDIADTLVTHGHTLFDLTLGLHLGRRAGWPPSRLDAVKLERDALAQVLIERTPALSAPASCKAIAEMTAHVRALAMQGELAVARRALRDSGVSAAELASRYPGGIERRMASLQQTPATASDIAALQP